MELSNLIGEVGFPIAVSIALFYQLFKTNELMRDFQITVYANTQTLQSLIRRIDKRRGDDDL